MKEDEEGREVCRVLEENRLSLERRLRHFIVGALDIRPVWLSSSVCTLGDALRELDTKVDFQGGSLAKAKEEDPKGRMQERGSRNTKVSVVSRKGNLLFLFLSEDLGGLHSNVQASILQTLLAKRELGSGIVIVPLSDSSFLSLLYCTSSRLSVLVPPCSLRACFSCSSPGRLLSFILTLCLFRLLFLLLCSSLFVVS